MGKQVLYVNPIHLDANPAIDALAYGLQHALHAAGMQLSVLFADFREPGYRKRYAAAIEAGIDARVDGIVIYALDPTMFGDIVAKARSAGIPVFSFVRPRYPVNASVVYPNFNQGVFMAEYLASMLPADSGVGVIGGPDTVDDAEEVAGLVYALKRSHCRLLNDPEDRQFCNVQDVAEGARAPMACLLQHVPQSHLHGLIPYNDETMLGCVQVLEEAGQLGNIKIVSRNGSPRAVDAVRAGKTVGTWDLDASGIGTTLGALVVRHLAGGEELEDYMTMSPVGRMITQENIASWRPWSERVEWTPLSVGL
ncbi:MAG: sugar ABC transporter substrate-binding protein [Candidatus Binatia bacterium]